MMPFCVRCALCGHAPIVPLASPWLPRSPERLLFPESSPRTCTRCRQRPAGLARTRRPRCWGGFPVGAANSAAPTLKGAGSARPGPAHSAQSTEHSKLASRCRDPRGLCWPNHRSVPREGPEGMHDTRRRTAFKGDERDRCSARVPGKGRGRTRRDRKSPTGFRCGNIGVSEHCVRACGLTPTPVVHPACNQAVPCGPVRYIAHPTPHPSHPISWQGPVRGQAGRGGAWGAPSHHRPGGQGSRPRQRGTTSRHLD